MYACGFEHTNLVDILLSAGATAHYTLPNGECALQTATAVNNEIMIAMLRASLEGKVYSSFSTFSGVMSEFINRTIVR
jgi:ankyrin repeat protein